MPTASDLVTDLPADFETFGQAVATSMADLLGGTTGQILSKASNTDMDFTWVTNDVGDITAVTAGTGISGGGTSGAVTVTNSMATAIDAKGDLIGGTGADTFARLAVGANGTVLTADSAEATGLKWATPSGGSSTFVGVKLNAVLKQSVTNNTDTAMIFDVEDFDTDGFHSNVTNNTRITIPAGKAGYYQIGGLIDFDNGAGGARTLRIKKNGTTEKQIITTPNTVYPGATLETILYLAVGDYVQLFATQTSGTTQDLYVDGSNGQLYAYFIGA